jgi:hypothetical protein
MIEQLIKSLPKMTGMRVLRLGADGWQQLLVKHAVPFASPLQQNTSLEQLPGLFEVHRHDPELHKAVILSIKRILVRNRYLHCAKSLLQPQQPQSQTSQTTKCHDATGVHVGTSCLICSRHGIWYKGLAQLGQKQDGISDYSGASAIFKLFQNRPDLIEQCLQQQE